MSEDSGYVDKRHLTLKPIVVGNTGKKKVIWVESERALGGVFIRVGSVRFSDLVDRALRLGKLQSEKVELVVPDGDSCVCIEPHMWCGGTGDMSEVDPGYCKACDELDGEEHCLRCPFDCCSE